MDLFYHCAEQPGIHVRIGLFLAVVIVGLPHIDGFGGYGFLHEFQQHVNSLVRVLFGKLSNITDKRMFPIDDERPFVVLFLFQPKTLKFLPGPLPEDTSAVSVNLGSFVAGLSGIGFKLLPASDGGRRFGFSDVYLPVGIHAVGQIDLYSNQFVGLFLAKQSQPVSGQQQTVSAIDIESLVCGESEDSLGLSVCSLRREVVFVWQDVPLYGYLLSNLFGRHDLDLALLWAEGIPRVDFMPAPVYCDGFGLQEPVKGH